MSGSRFVISYFQPPTFIEALAKGDFILVKVVPSSLKKTMLSPVGIIRLSPNLPQSDLSVVGLLQLGTPHPEEIDKLFRVIASTAWPKSSTLTTCEYHAIIVAIIYCHILRNLIVSFEILM